MDPEIELYYQNKTLSHLGLIMADSSLRFCQSYDYMKDDLGVCARDLLRCALKDVRDAADVIEKRLDTQL